MYLMYVFSLLASAAFAASRCKPLPGSVDWPSTKQWKALNESVSGRLASAVPPAAVCHLGQPTFNNASCAVIAQQWSNTSFHAANPWTPDYNDDSCPPDPTAPCSTAGYPAYAITVTKADDVKAAVRFAARTGVRLTVKGTGHDYPGRSSGRGALELWMHQLRGAEVLPGNKMKIAAGMQWRDIYAEAAKHKITVVGGADPDVGIGGWIMWGGHSPISRVFGLGADQVLEMEVVTADGQHRTINPSCEADLFWAMRGGGGSTFAVMLSVTVKTHPSLAGTIYTFAYNTTSNTDSYWTMVANFHSQLPRISDAGAMGYYYVLPVSGSPDPARAGIVAGGWLFFDKTPQQIAKIMGPLEQGLRGPGKDTVFNTSSLQPFPDFTSAWLMNPPEAAGSDGRLGSWLLDKKALTQDVPKLKQQLQKATPAAEIMIGHLIAGKGVHDAKPAGGSNAVLPAWRNAYSHLVLPRTWTNAVEKAALTKELRDQGMPALKELAPDSGAYINEGDPSNPNWKHDYYGANYPRLLQIKQRWDPHGVFWCKPCVGHELWEVIDGPKSEDGLEWGIGQGAGKICRK